jgi:hypothetical protein
MDDKPVFGNNDLFTQHEVGLDKDLKDLVCKENQEYYE